MAQSNNKHEGIDSAVKIGAGMSVPPMVSGPYKNKVRSSTFMGRASMRSFVSRKSRKK